MKFVRIAAPLFGLLLAAGLFGCGQKEEFGDKKEDWSKTAPPAGWKGPGQAGGPGSGAVTGPPAEN